MAARGKRGRRGLQGQLTRIALRSCDWSERWFPDAYAFAALAAVMVAAAAMACGSTPLAAATAFGDGFWSLIPFTMQMVFVIIGGYVVAASPPVERAIDRVAALPRNGRSAVALVAAVSMLASLLHWGLSIVVSGLLVRSMGRRYDLDMDYRAAGAAAYLGLGSVWALGLSSSAAQLEANAASQPAALLKIAGIIPFGETIFLWQSLLLLVILLVVSVGMAWLTAPVGAEARTARALGIDLHGSDAGGPHQRRPGEWLERSPLLNIAIAVLGLGWLWHEFAAKGVVSAIASLNTYNFLFLTAGLLLQWRPRRFLDTVARAVPSTAGVLIQFPIYAGIASVLTAAHSEGGLSVAQYLARFFTEVADGHSFPVVMGLYSAVLGFFIPSGGGKWVIEAPYVLQAAKDLHVHLGWAVQVYNAAEALPNLVNPFWMLPVLGILRLKARDLIGFSFLQFLAHLPLVLLLLWALGLTLQYHDPTFPTSS